MNTMQYHKVTLNCIANKAAAKQLQLQTKGNSGRWGEIGKKNVGCGVLNVGCAV
jgi:hypothetical protein